MREVLQQLLASLRLQGMGQTLDAILAKAEAEALPVAEALHLLLQEIEATATSPQEYQVKMFGGGSQFMGLAMDVATKNVEAGLDLLRSHHLPLMSMHLGGTGHRQVVLDVSTGDVWVRHIAL